MPRAVQFVERSEIRGIPRNRTRFDSKEKGKQQDKKEITLKRKSQEITLITISPYAPVFLHFYIQFNTLRSIVSRNFACCGFIILSQFSTVPVQPLVMCLLIIYFYISLYSCLNFGSTWIKLIKHKVKQYSIRYYILFPPGYLLSGKPMLKLSYRKALLHGRLRARWTKVVCWWTPRREQVMPFSSLSFYSWTILVRRQLGTFSNFVFSFVCAWHEMVRSYFG